MSEIKKTIEKKPRYVVVRQSVLDQQAKKNIALPLARADWEERKGDFGPGFNESEISKLKQEVKRAEQAFSLALLQLRGAQMLAELDDA